MNNRKRYKALEPRYSILWKGDKCYYCGDKADTYDHVPAISTTYSLGVEALEKKGVRLYKVRCCRECNSILSDKMILFLEKRHEHLYEKYMKRYKKVFLYGVWTEKEMDEAEFDYNLRSYIESHNDIKSWIERRMQFMEQFL